MRAESARSKHRSGTIIAFDENIVSLPTLPRLFALACSGSIGHSRTHTHAPILAQLVLWFSPLFSPSLPLYCPRCDKDGNNAIRNKHWENQPQKDSVPGRMTRTTTRRHWWQFLHGDLHDSRGIGPHFFNQTRVFGAHQTRLGTGSTPSRMTTLIFVLQKPHRRG